MRAIKARIARVEQEACKTTRRYAGTPGGGTHGDHVAKGAVEIADLQCQRHEILIGYARAAKDIETAIATITDPRMRDVMARRYVDGFHWGEVADVLGYSASHCLALHRQALCVLGVEEEQEENLP